jgi:hypothetical protein
VRIQIAVALIAFRPLRLARAAQTLVHSPSAFARLVRVNLMQRGRIDCLLRPEPASRPNPDQPTVQWA